MDDKVLPYRRAGLPDPAPRDDRGAYSLIAAAVVAVAIPALTWWVFSFNREHRGEGASVTVPLLLLGWLLGMVANLVGIVWAVRCRTRRVPDRRLAAAGLVLNSLLLLAIFGALTYAFASAD